MYRTDVWTLWETARVGCCKRTASKHVYYLGWNRSPAQVGCMRQALGTGALARARGIGWRGRWEGGSGWGTHVNPWLIHFNVWQNPLQYCKVITLQLIKKKEKKKKLVCSLPSVHHSWSCWSWEEIHHLFSGHSGSHQHHITERENECCLKNKENVIFKRVNQTGEKRMSF